MPVGAGSIKRAAKANVAAGTKAEKPVVVKAEEPSAEMPVAKKTETKKNAAPKKAAPKKVEEKVVAPVVKSVNEVCHLTEELPIHLL